MNSRKKGNRNLILTYKCDQKGKEGRVIYFRFYSGYQNLENCVSIFIKFTATGVVQEYTGRWESKKRIIAETLTARELWNLRMMGESDLVNEIIHERNRFLEAVKKA